MTEFRMPSLGADMDAGTLIEWTVAPGAPVKRGDIVAVVETQKGAIEIEVFEDGVFERPLVEIGTKVPVGLPIAVIAPAVEAAAMPPAPAAAPSVEAAPQVAVAPTPAAATETVFVPELAETVPPAPPAAPVAAAVMSAPPAISTPMEGRPRVTPAARRLAETAGVDLVGLVGTGPEGEIALADVEARIAAKPAAKPAPTPTPPPAPAAGRGIDPAAMRAAIAAAMARSKREIPHYYLTDTVDLTRAEAFVAERNAGREPADRLLLGTLFVAAVARAVKKYPEFNGHLVDGTFAASKAVHVGVAVNIRGTGLVAPAIHDTDRLGLDELMAAMRDLVVRVRAGRFRSSELADPTITVSSLGERGVEALWGVIYPPQVAIVGFGTPMVRPWAVDGMVGPRKTVVVTLAGDHRVSDGHRGALFLHTIVTLLQEPEAL
jgi:pyruvate dehydrogenase E2 component (dihydrolipoamide acetyltransferase)